MTFKVLRLLSLLILLLSLCLTSLAVRQDPAAEVLRCLDGCDDEDVQEYIACHKECELRYLEREERQEEEGRPGSRELDPRWRRGRGGGGGGGGGEREPEDPRGEREPAWGPGGEYDQCRRLCEPYKRQERERCWEQCEERERARERLRDREREREVNGGVRNPPGDASRPERHERWCERACKRHASGQQRQLCKFRCRQRREREQQRETPGGGDVAAALTEDPQQQFQHCQQRCQQQQRRECQEERERQFREQQRGKRGSTNPQEQEVEEEEEEEVGESEDNPYYFHSQTLRSWFRAEEGQIRVLGRFDKRSELLRGLKNYRLEIFEANPNTFVLPGHVDADCLLVVLKGEGTISLVWQEKKESHHLERGDVIAIPAGTTAYFVSSGCNGHLQIAKLIQPVNTPGTFEEFDPVSTENRESYYAAFSSEILESSLKTSRDQIERLFGRQRRGVMIRASEEQRQALSERRGWSKKKGHGSKGPFNLLGQKPTYSNEFGRFFQASPDEFKQLRDMGISVTFAEVYQGSIMVPHYNSKSTMVVVVVEGYGWFEMACPHLARTQHRWGSGGEREQEEEEERETEQGGSARYQKVTSQLSPGDVFVIPAGHPISIVAYQNKNLRMVGFGINAHKNQRIFLAGKENIINQMDREAKELSFDLPAIEVDRVFRNQEESYFVPLQQQQQQPQREQREHHETEKSQQYQQSKQMDKGDSVGSGGSSSSTVASVLNVAGIF
ncbi:hypothetical protein BT93_H2088 [Corymbia citriodora subsp. variegata]|nr:hypothetical protein BT93_H2088 [Corymbia citriodora subsp. variegata]